MMTGTKIATFLFHDVSDTPWDSGFQRRSALPYKMSRRAFADHMDRLAASGAKPKLVTELDFQKPERNVLLTFDDGGKGAIQAADELNRHGWKGHFFVTTGRIGSNTFLDATGVRYLQSCGHLIGSHSQTHPDIFKLLSMDEMIQEWLASCNLLSDILGTACLTASVPGGDVSPRVFQSAHNAGLRFLFTSDPFLTPKLEGDCWIIGRVCIKTDTSLSDVQKLAEFRGWSKVLARRRMKTITKTLFSPLYEIYVRRALH